ncbi:TatD family hydrolase [Candidatus Magnetoovum chiemensis]|nr:TatD family hydrolase [Candidatus Magnetoovum chiemensis]
MRVFRQHLQLAKELDLPVVVHSRDAEKDTIEILKESDIKRGVIHCFSYDEKIVKEFLKMKFYISFSGIVTYKNADEVRLAAKIVPDDLLLIETDAPYLSPAPFRGKTNEPSYVKYTAEALAKLRGVTLEDIDRLTALNAKTLFALGTPSSADVYAYKIRNSLYLNITNKCTNHCGFCVRNVKDFVKGHNLRLKKDPTYEEIIAAIKDNVALYRPEEIVFCGYGEPLIRLDTVKNVSQWIKQQGFTIRINTNGQANLIHKRNILPELKGLTDSMSISLDAHNEEIYNKICKPSYKGSFNAVVDFIKEAPKYIPDVTATIVDVEDVDIEQCRQIASSLGVKFRIRHLDIVG